MEAYPSPRDGQPFQTHPPMTPNERRSRYPSFSNTTYYYDRDCPENGGYPEPRKKFSTCFNCGSPEHWAQDCPRPREFDPAGAEIGFQPSKRQKTSRPIPMSQSFPPPYKQQWGDPLTGAQPNYPVHNNFPPTPMSTHSADYYPWQPSPPQASPRQPFPASGSHELQNPISTHNPQFVSPVSPNGGHQYHGYFPPQHHQQHFALNWEHQQYSYQQHNQQPPDYGRSRPLLHHQHALDDNRPSWPPGQPWVEDRQSYERQPGMKSSRDQIVWRPPNLAARPLPSSFSAQDEIEPVTNVEALKQGMSVSRYISDKDAEDLKRHIRETKYWSSLKDDPIFRVISTDCELISIEELVSRRNRILRTHSLRIPKETEEGEVHEDNVEAGRDRSSSQRFGGHRNSVSENPQPEKERVDDRVSFRERSRETDRARPYFEQKSTRKRRHESPGDSDRRLKRHAVDSRSYREPAMKIHPHHRQPMSVSGSYRNYSSNSEYRSGRGPGRQQPSHLPDTPYQGENAKHWGSRSPPHSERRGRKRPRSADSSEDRYDGPRRQENDVPKARARQAEVSSVYSRRW
ncbi:hypothetical protein VTN96DRAFT_4925 [Rasamsonia emersonii]